MIGTDCWEKMGCWECRVVYRNGQAGRREAWHHGNVSVACSMYLRGRISMVRMAEALGPAECRNLGVVLVEGRDRHLVYVENFCFRKKNEIQQSGNARFVKTTINVQKMCQM